MTNANKLSFSEAYFFGQFFCHSCAPVAQILLLHQTNKTQTKKSKLIHMTFFTFSIVTFVWREKLLPIIIYNDATTNDLIGYNFYEPIRPYKALTTS